MWAFLSGRVGVFGVRQDLYFTCFDAVNQWSGHPLFSSPSPLLWDAAARPQIEFPHRRVRLSHGSVPEPRPHGRIAEDHRRACRLLNAPAPPPGGHRTGLPCSRPALCRATIFRSSSPNLASKAGVRGLGEGRRVHHVGSPRPRAWCSCN